MLRDIDAAATVAVKDIDRARTFYQDTLGFEIVDSQGEEVIVFKSGRTTFNVYRSEFAGTNEATAVTWVVGSHLEKLVTTLKDKGVTFLHYDMPGTVREGDIHTGGNVRVAWFKDPDGNILSLVNA